MPQRTLTGQIVYGNALGVNGSSQYISRANVSSASNNFSVALWAYINSYNGGTTAMFNNGETDANGYVVRVGSTGTLNTDLSFVANLSSGTTLALNTWYHIVVVRNAGTLQHYVNGSAAGGTSGSSPNGPGGFTTLGASRVSGGTASQFFNGLLDDVRLYDRALSTAEITALYNYGLNINNPNISSANLKVWYKLDETSGNPADSSGNGNTGTNTGTATFVSGKVQITNTPARTLAGARTLATWRRFLPGAQIQSTAPFGMNCSGLEGGGTLPGTLNTNYFEPSAQNFLDLASLGFTTVRLPYLWERMEPVLGAGLDPIYSGYVDSVASNAGAAGIKLILDMHNFGRRAIYKNGGITENFTESPELNLFYPWADYSANGYIVLRDYGQCFLGTTANPVSPATGYSVSYNMTFNSQDDSFGNEGFYCQPMYQDSNNYYQFTANYAAGTWEVYKYIAGVKTSLASGSKTWVLGTTYSIVVDVNQATNGKVNVSVNGTPLYTTNSVNSDATHLLTGQVGFLSEGMHTQIDTLVLNINGDTSSGGTTAIAVGNTGVAITDFANHWAAMSNHYKNNVNVLGYDLMNEWHDMPSGDPTPSTYSTVTSALANQAAINAIRATGDTKYIIIEYDSYSNMHKFTTFFGSNPNPWWTDSLNKVILSPHYYFDSNHSGDYTSSPFTNSLFTRIVSECIPLLSWCKIHNIPCMVGEWAMPLGVEGYYACGEYFLNLCAAYGAGTFYWTSAKYTNGGSIALQSSFPVVYPHTTADQYTNVLTEFRGTAL